MAPGPSGDALLDILGTIEETFWVWTVDPPAALFVSPSYERLWGRSAQSLLDKPDSYLEGVHGADRPQAAQNRARQAKGERTEQDLRVVHPDGQIRWIALRAYPALDVAGHVDRVACVAADITARKAYEESLRREGEPFRILAETAHDAILTADTTGAVRYVNPAALRMFGYSAQEMLGQPLTRLMPERFRDAHLAGFARFASTGEGRLIGQTVELFGLRKDGREFPLELSLGAWTTADGLFATGVMRDVSERHAVEEERRGRERAERALEAQKQLEEERGRVLAAERHAREQAEEANRIKNEFLAVLSHELRTPLSAIVGWAHLLDEGGLDEASRVTAIKTIIRNADTQTRLISDLLDVSRILRGRVYLDLQPTSLAAIITATRDTLRPAALARRIEVVLRLDEAAAPVQVDPERVQQVLWNILSNAIRFTQEGGRVVVTLDDAGGRSRITVVDNGPGISPEFLPYVFDTFRQGDASTTRRFGGLGLGLSIAKQIVELHGGAVSAANAEEGGAVITLTIPRVAPPPAQARGAAAPPPLALPSLAGARILVVDDEPDARQLAAAVLESARAEVATAGSAAEAYRLFSELRPSALLVDIGMPGEDGCSLVARIRALPYARGGMTPAVALTAYVSAKDRLRALEAGFQVYLGKPAAPADLVSALSGLLGFSREGTP